MDDLDFEKTLRDSALYKAMSNLRNKEPLDDKKPIGYYDSIENRWAHIRKVYKEVHFEKIMKKGKMNPYDLFDFDFTKYASHLEKYAWHRIRCLGRFPMFPEVPVLNYFIDFANPKLKIGIEMDGSTYHDKAKDLKRDKEIFEKEGYIIFRIPTNECWTGANTLCFSGDENIHEMEQWEIDEIIEKWFLTTCEGVIAAIRTIYFRDNHFNKYHEICMNTLENHCLLELDFTEYFKYISE